MAGKKKKFTHPRLMTVDPDFVLYSTQENDEILLTAFLDSSYPASWPTLCPVC